MLMLAQVYGDNAMRKTAVYKWVKRFSEGRDSVTDEESSGRPATSRTEENIAKVRHVFRENCRLTVRSIAEQVNIDRETVRKILTEDLDMRKVCAKMVPKELTEEQKQRRVFSYQTNNCVGTPYLFTRSSPTDFFLFPKIKEILKGRHFDDTDDIRSNTTAALKAIPQNQFQNYFERWARRWHRCIAFQGEYFEGDHGGIQQ